MYLEYFSLKEFPFSITPNSQFYANLSTHQDCINTLLVALQCGEGFVKVIGEVGTGKTLLCRKLMGMLDERCFYTAYIPNPYLTPDELRHALAHELRVNNADEYSDQVLLQHIYQRLIEISSAGARVVLLVDEAQAMKPETLEALRLLTNLETEKEKLLQVVLFGQPELELTLNRQDLRQLKQRVTFAQNLRPLNEIEISHYIHHRMAVAGHIGMPLFTEDAIRFLYKKTKGTPRLINISCHKALIVAFGRGDRQVDLLHVRRALADVEVISARNWWQRIKWPVLG